MVLEVHSETEERHKARFGLGEREIESFLSLVEGMFHAFGGNVISEDRFELGDCDVALVGGNYKIARVKSRK